MAHVQNTHHLFFKARLELIERQACFISPESSSIKNTSEKTDIYTNTQQACYKAREKADVIGL